MATRPEVEITRYIFTPGEILALKELARRKDEIFDAIERLKKLSAEVYKLGEKVEDLKKTTDYVSKLSEDARKQAEDALDKVNRAIAKVSNLEQIADTIKKDLETAFDKLENLKTQLESLLDEVSSKIGDLSKDIAGFFQSFFNDIQSYLDDFKKTWNDFNSAFLNTLQLVASRIDSVGGAFRELTAMVDGKLDRNNLDIKYWHDKAKSDLENGDYVHAVWDLLQELRSLIIFSFRVVEFVNVSYKALVDIWGAMIGLWNTLKNSFEKALQMDKLGISLDGISIEDIPQVFNFMWSDVGLPRGPCHIRLVALEAGKVISAYWKLTFTYWEKGRKKTKTVELENLPEIDTWIKPGRLTLWVCKHGTCLSDTITLKEWDSVYRTYDLARWVKQGFKTSHGAGTSEYVWVK